MSNLWRRLFCATLLVGLLGFSTYSQADVNGTVEWIYDEMSSSLVTRHFLGCSWV